MDDAIIAVEMMVRKLQEGYSKERAATFAYEVTSMPMLTGTLITAAGFLPIGLARSMTGEYTFAIFAVTSAALLISWGVSVYFVPYLGARLLHTRMKAHEPDGSVSTQPHETFDSPFYQRFRRVIAWCLSHRWITIGATIATFMLGLVGMGLVQQQFLPRLEPARDPGRPVAARGRHDPAERGGGQALRGPPAQGTRREGGDHVGGQRHTALLPAHGPGVPAEQRQRGDRRGRPASTCAKACARSCPR